MPRLMDGPKFETLNSKLEGRPKVEIRRWRHERVRKPGEKWDHEPRSRSADSLVREFLPIGPRGLSVPRSEERFMGSLLFLADLLTSHEPASRCSADWQSAVSRIGNPQTPLVPNAPPTASRRHSRLPTCATGQRFMESRHGRESRFRPSSFGFRISDFITGNYSVFKYSTKSFNWSLVMSLVTPC